MITSTQDRATIGKLLALVVLLTALAASLALAARPSYAATVFTVNSTADHADANLADNFCDTGGSVPGTGDSAEMECTLRAAIQQANYTSGADTINFAIADTRQPIAPASALPTITQTVTINGYTQPGAKPNTKAVGSDAVLKVEISGFGGGAGLEITASNSTIKGLVINSSGAGIRIDDPTATGNRVVGNYLGTDTSGTQDLGNDAYGISVDGANNTVGGATPAARNVISGNGQKGVVVSGSGATGTRILSNSIYSHAGLGIDLGDDGSTANDPGDVDTGPNNLQNKPVISSAGKSATGTTTVRGTLDSTPGKTFTVQFFSNPEGTDEGKTLLGSESVKTDGTGNFSFAFSTKKAIRLGQNITATAAGADGTSEFSAPRKVVAR